MCEGEEKLAAPHYSVQLRSILYRERERERGALGIILVNMATSPIIKQTTTNYPLSGN